MGIGTSLVWIFLENHVPEMSQAVYWVSDRLFGISDLPYSRAGIRILAEEERKNRIVIIYLFIYLFIYLLIRLRQKSGRAARIESHGAYYIQATHLQTKFRII